MTSNNDGNENIGLRPARGICNGILLSIPLWAIIGGAVWVVRHSPDKLLTVTIGGLALMALLVVYACALQIRHDQQTRELQWLESQNRPVVDRLDEIARAK